MRRKYDVVYAVYSARWESERLRSELGIGPRRLITLLETGSTKLEVVEVVDAITDVILLDDTEYGPALLDHLKKAMTGRITQENWIPRSGRE